MTPRLSRKELAKAGIVVARKPAPNGVRVVAVQNTTSGRVVTNVTKLRVVSAKSKSALRERAFLALLAQAGLPVPIPEFRFHPVRRWRIDYSYPDAKLAIEVEGGVWSRGKHGRGSGIVKDMAKGNALACAGWRLLRVTPDQLATGATVLMIAECLGVAK